MRPGLVLAALIFSFNAGGNAFAGRNIAAREPLRRQAASNPLEKKTNLEVPDRETLLLEFMLGEQGSILWVVSPDSVDAYELPCRATIEQAAQRVLDLLTARLPRENESNREAYERALRTRNQFPAAAENLAQAILGPIANRLRTQRLLVVADGALHLIPFAVLPKPHAAKRRKQVPLLVDHEIVYLPSASVLGMVRQRRQTRPLPPKMLALFADPVFEKDDFRFHAELAGPLNSREVDTHRSALAAATGFPEIVGSLRRLRFARQEADAIWASLSDAERALSLEAYDFAANQELALSPELAQYRYLHFATHGIFDHQHPDLSGMALSLRNQNGQTQDGFLRLVEIYNLELSAELVTLSACETGLGKQVGGEGVIGLTRGFLHAGASRVLVSLWKVDDRASARLMGRIYEAIFREKLSPAAALRKAQLSFLHDPAIKDPFLWAAFVLHGEPR